MKNYRWIKVTTLSILMWSGVAQAATPALPSGEFPVNLMFSKADIPRLLANTKLPLFREFWQEQLKLDGTKDHNIMREAFIYALTGDRKRGEIARQEMLKVLKRKRWDTFVEDGKHTVGFLTAGRLTAWMSMGYDWIYDLLSQEERDEILRQIAEKGCVPLNRALYGMRYPNTVKGWGFDPAQTYHIDVPDMSRWPIILGKNNFRAVINGGFALALATLDGKDDRVEEWREMLMDSYPKSAELFEEDGAYDEGIAYCNYAMTYLMYCMEAVKRHDGIELFDAANYTGMMETSLSLFMPQHLNPNGSVNFGDASGSMSSAAAFWVARKSRDGLSQYIGLNYAPKHTLFSLLYYDPTVSARKPYTDAYFNQLSLDWIVTRTGFEMDDLVVAMRSGAPANHEHADRNSVILKYGGEMLLVDQNRPTYNYKLPGWFLRTSLAHNTVVIDGDGQQYHDGSEGTNEGKSSAKIIRSGRRPGLDFWASDATPAYAILNEDVKSVTRTTLVLPELPAMIVLDKLQKHKHASTFAARWFVENRDGKGAITTDGQTFTMTRPHARFYGKAAGDQPVKVEATKLALPDTLGTFKYLNTEMTDKAEDAFIILAGYPLMPGEALPEISIEKAEEAYLIKLNKGTAKAVIKVIDSGAVPEFEVIRYENGVPAGK